MEAEPTKTGERRLHLALSALIDLGGSDGRRRRSSGRSRCGSPSANGSRPSPRTTGNGSGRPASFRRRCAPPAPAAAPDSPAARLLQMRQRGRPALSGTSSKRSTSTSPWSVIFRLGITERARKASDWKGTRPREPSAWTAATVAALASITSCKGRSRRGRPKRQFGHDRAADVHDDEPAADLDEPADDPRDFLVVRPTTTMLCAS